VLPGVRLRGREEAMTATESDIAALLAAVEADPLDTAPRLILADAVEEMGDGEGAGLLRTAVPAPSFDNYGNLGTTCWWTTGGKGRAPQSDVPARLLHLMDGHAYMSLAGDFVRYTDHAAAFLALARAVVRAAREARP
jgi:uncharacterized protein (TIGR02996 family)